MWKRNADSAAATHTVSDDHQCDVITEVAPALGLSGKTNRQVDPL